VNYKYSTLGVISALGIFPKKIIFRKLETARLSRDFRRAAGFWIYTFDSALASSLPGLVAVKVFVRSDR
jgi:hypothetical protein